MYVFVNEFNISDEFLDLEGNDRLIFVLDELKLKTIRELSEEANIIHNRLSRLQCYLGFDSIDLFFAEVFLATEEDVCKFIEENRSEIKFIQDFGSMQCYEIKDVDLVMTMYGIESEFDISGAKLKIRDNNWISIVTSIDNSNSEIFSDSICLDFLK